MEEFFGFTKLNDYGLYLRGILITLYAIFIFRVNLSRIYGNHSPLDFIIYIILGAILGEAIVNNIPLLPSIVVSTLIICIYRFLTWLTYKNHIIGKYIKGEKITLIRDGDFIQKNMERSRVTKHDVLQALRLQHGTEDLKKIHLAILERGGQISFQLQSVS
ncbi:MAG: DUF421 domain-containing protein [Legionella sp. 40-6]|nr:DUF421 domain-containing protein [Legionella sp.]OJY02559.1 MAG: DUF421 domain-containing protein [Legionella sp. 40-6]